MEPNGTIVSTQGNDPFGVANTTAGNGHVIEMTRSSGGRHNSLKQKKTKETASVVNNVEVISQTDTERTLRRSEVELILHETRPQS